MEAKIKLIIDRDEFDDYCVSKHRENKIVPSMSEVKSEFIDRFLSNKNDYVDCHSDFEAVLNINGKEVQL